MNYINKGKRDILIFPNFPNIDKIQKIRDEHDELASIIPPHITLAFPFNIDLSNEELKEKLENILSSVKPFKVVCKGITLRRDERVNATYIFLDIVEGKDTIQRIHERIYSEILPDIDIKKYNYVPHITLGTLKDENEIVEVSDSFETIIDKVYVESIGENEESIIEFNINLG